MKRCSEFLLGMGFMAALAVINFSWQASFKQITYEINPEYSGLDFFHGSFWVFRSVLFEELLFRGAILYLLIRYIGIIKACLLSSVIFGVYHWFSYEVFGARPVLMLYIFLVTGMGGWMFAFAYAKTKSLFAPVGLHLGWNLVTAIVFSSGPLGNQWLIQQGEAVHASDWITLIFFSLQAVVAPGLVTLYLLGRYKSNERSAVPVMR
ncbi:lysostaphin resistance A-like protein [Microbulbifer agarilyticus]